MKLNELDSPPVRVVIRLFRFYELLYLFLSWRETFFFFFFFLYENEIDIACRKEHKEGGQGAVVTRFVNCEYRRGKSVARLRTTQGLKRVYYCKAADDEARNCAPERCIPLYPPTPPVPLISPSLSLAFYRQNCIFPWFSIAARPTRRARTRTSLRKSIDFSRIKEFPTCSLNPYPFDIFPNFNSCIGFFHSIENVPVHGTSCSLLSRALAASSCYQKNNSRTHSAIRINGILIGQNSYIKI